LSKEFRKVATIKNPLILYIDLNQNLITLKYYNKINWIEENPTSTSITKILMIPSNLNKN
jgi:hypothetical protein